MHKSKNVYLYAWLIQRPALYSNLKDHLIKHNINTLTTARMTYKFLHLPTLNGALDDNSLEMSIKIFTHRKSVKIWLIHVSAPNLEFVRHGIQNGIINVPTISR